MCGGEWCSVELWGGVREGGRDRFGRVPRLREVRCVLVVSLLGVVSVVRGQVALAGVMEKDGSGWQRLTSRPGL